MTVIHLRDLPFNTCLDGLIGWVSDFKAVMVAVRSSNLTGGNILVNSFFPEFLCLTDLLSDFLSDLLIVKNPNVFKFNIFCSA